MLNIIFNFIKENNLVLLHIFLISCLDFMLLYGVFPALLKAANINLTKQEKRKWRMFIGKLFTFLVMCIVFYRLSAFVLRLNCLSLKI